MRRWFIAVNILFSIIGVLSIALAFSSFFLFDAPGSEQNNIVWAMFWSSIALPFACLASVITSSIIAYKTSNYKKALYVALLPVIVIAVLVVSLILLEIVCQGVFSCGYS